MYNLETNIFKRIKLLNEENRILIITDDNIYNLYNDNLKNYKILVIDSGENSKSIENVQKILKYLLINKYNRKDTLLVGFGGGVIGDLTGFVASIYMRGIKYVQIPTTLLAMVDSSIGGKTGINFNNIKNSVGTFYKPENIYLHFNFLDKLPREEIINGWAEILKIILISSKKLWNFIKVHNIDYFLENPSKFNEIIEISAKLKFDIVNSDYKEQLNKRIYLNFGHTIGHAIESLTLMKHGYCVAIGMLKEIELIDQLKIEFPQVKFNKTTHYIDENYFTDWEAYSKTLLFGIQIKPISYKHMASPFQLKSKEHHNKQLELYKQTFNVPHIIIYYEDNNFYDKQYVLNQINTILAMKLNVY